MQSRRKRFIVHCHSSGTLLQIREALGRSVELIIANDVKTFEAALRLYQQVQAVIVEKSPEIRLPELPLTHARTSQPSMPRVLLVDFEAMRDAHTALTSGLVTRLVFTPFSAAELLSAVNAEEPACVPAASRHLRAG